MRAHRTVARGIFAMAALLGATAVVSTVASGVIEARRPPRGRFIRTGRGAGLVHVLEDGPATADVTLVLLHGASINAEDLMFAFAGRFGPRVRLIAVDRPGSGRSDRPAGHVSALPGHQAETVLAALDAMGVKDFVVLGHSWGAAAALHLAAHHPDRVRGLATLAGVTQPSAAGKLLLGRRGGLRFLSDFAVRSFFGPLTLLLASPITRFMFRPQKPPRGYAEKVGVRLLADPDRFIANAEDLVFMEQGVEMLAPRIRRVTAPVLIMHGDADRIVPAEQSRRLHELIPGSRLLVLPGIGHMIHHAAPTTVIGAIEDLIRTVRVDASPMEARAICAAQRVRSPIST